MTLVPNIVPATVYPERKVDQRIACDSRQPRTDLRPARRPCTALGHRRLGNRSVGARSGNPDRLSLGARFGMNMKHELPYRISNTVSAFEENLVIEWHHPGRHRWRYELEALDGGTRVTETFDWGSGLVPLAYEMVGYPERHRTSIDQTFERLHRRFAAGQ